MNQTRYFRFTLSPLSLRTHSTSSICDHGVPPRDLGTIAREDPRRTYQEDGELWSNGDRRPADAAASARRPGQAFVPSVWIIDPPPRAQCYPRLVAGPRAMAKGRAASPHASRSADRPGHRGSHRDLQRPHVARAAAHRRPYPRAVCWHARGPAPRVT